MIHRRISGVFCAGVFAIGCGSGGGDAGGGGGSTPDAGPGGSVGGSGGSVGGSGGAIGGSGGSIGGSGGAIGGSGGEIGGSGGEIGGSGGEIGGSGGEIGGSGGEIGGSGGEIGGSGGEIGGSGGSGGAQALCGEAPLFPAELVPGDPDAYTITGTSGDSAVSRGSCGGDGRETFLEFTAPAAGYWTLSPDASQTDFPAVLYALEGCDAGAAELACGYDPADWFAPERPLALELAAGQTIPLVVDALRGRGGQYTVSALRAEGPEVPVIDAVSAYLGPDGGTRLRIDATDPNGDLIYARVSFLDADGAPLDPFQDGTTVFAQPTLRNMLGARQATGLVSIPDFGLSFDGVRISVVDATDNESPTIDVARMPQPVAAENDACDPFGIESSCADDLPCVRGAEGAVCVAPSPPTMTSARAFHEADDTLSFVVTGHDDTQDAVAFIGVLLSAESDEPLVMSEWGTTELRFGGSFEGLDDFETVNSFRDGFDPVLLATVPEAARVGFLVEDAHGLRSDWLIVDIEDAPIFALGDACSPDGLGGRCALGLRCASLYGGTEGLCTEAHAPELESVAAFHSRTDEITVTATAHDEDTDLAFVEVSLLPADSDEPIDLAGDGTFSLVYYPAPRPDDPTRFDFGARLSAGFFWDPIPIYLADHPEATRVRFVAHDSGDATSEPSIVELLPLPEAALGDVCDALGASDECVAGSVCAAPEGELAGVCEARSAPVLTEFIAAYNDVTKRAGFDVRGTDVDQDAQADLEIHLFDGDPDAGGLEVEIPVWGNPARVYWDIFAQDGEDFSGRLFIETAASPENAIAPFTHARVAVVDQAGFLSNFITVEVAPAATVAIGEPCDTLHAFDNCDAAGICNPNLGTCDANVCGDGSVGWTEDCDREPGVDDGCSDACAFEVPVTPLAAASGDTPFALAGPGTSVFEVTLDAPALLEARITDGAGACPAGTAPDLTIRRGEADGTWRTLWPVPLALPDYSDPLYPCTLASVAADAATYRIVVANRGDPADAVLTLGVAPN